MQENGPNRPPRLLNEDEVRRVLKRAAELESSRQGLITEDLLIEIAEEAGISAEAVTAALEEARSVSTNSGPKDQRWSVKPIAKVLAGATALGMVSRALRPLLDHGAHWESLAALAVLCGYLGVNAWKVERRKPQLAFQLKNLAGWTGFAAGWSVVHGYVWGDLIGVTGAYAVGFAVIGGAVVALRNTTSAASPLGSGPPASGFVRSRWRRLKQRMGRDSDGSAPLRLQDLSVALRDGGIQGTEAVV